jgi:hypothetical protein
MPRTAAKVSQADIARVLRAVAQTGTKMRVEISPDGTIRMEPVEGADRARFDRKAPVDL